jgi:hypothetical protein
VVFVGVGPLPLILHLWPQGDWTVTGSVVWLLGILQQVLHWWLVLVVQLVTTKTLRLMWLMEEFSRHHQDSISHLSKSSLA